MGTYRAKSATVKPLGRPLRLTSALELVNGHNAISTMNVSVLAVLSFFVVTSIFSEDPSGPVITVRKGTSQQVEVKELSGPAGPAATSILKNDIQLSGALSLADAATEPSP